MAYSKQNFYAGQTLKAEHLNNIENGIIANATAIEGKQPKGSYLTEHQKIKTINGQSLVGNGNIIIEAGNNDTNLFMIPNPVDKSVYSGKTIACIGDSVTAGVGAKPNYVTNLGTELGATTKNLGASGTVLCTGGNRGCNIGKLSVKNLSGADIVTILMGVNDWDQAGKGYYELGDINTTDTTTIYGAVRMWCDKIMELKQTESLANTKFYFMTPPITSWNHSVGANNWDQNKVNIHGYKFRDLCQAIIDVCFEYQIPVIDLNLYSGIYYNSVEDETVTQYGGDGIHPNAAGHAKITEAIIRAFEQNPTYKPTTDSINYILDFLSKELGTELSYPVAVKEYVKKEVPLTEIKLSVSELPLEAGATYTVTAMLQPENTTQTNIVWTSSNNSVATVNDGVITAIAEGNATITCKSADNSNIYATVALSVVSAASNDLTALVVSNDTVTVEAGKTHTLTVAYVPASTNQKGIQWTSDNHAVATVAPSSDGLSCVVTAIGEGQCYIKATSTVNSNISDSCFFTTSAAGGSEEPEVDTSLFTMGANATLNADGSFTATAGGYGKAQNIVIYKEPLKAGMEVELIQTNTNTGNFTGFQAWGVDGTTEISEIKAGSVYQTGMFNFYVDEGKDNVQSLAYGSLNPKTGLGVNGGQTSPRVSVIKRDASGKLSGTFGGQEITMPSHAGITAANETENLYVWFPVTTTSTWKINYYGALRS